MKKYILGFVFSFAIIGCSHQPAEPTISESGFSEPKYDTTPVDSFSHGATSAAVALSIKMSSSAYKDSIKLALQKEIELKKQQDFEAKLKKEEEEKLKKEKATQIVKEKAEAKSTTTSATENP
jgi:hypothetical protein